MILKFGERLRELRKDKGLSQVQLAKLLENKITKTAIGLWELNQRTPNLEAAAILAQFFNVSLDYLAGLTEFK